MIITNRCLYSWLGAWLSLCLCACTVDEAEVVGAGVNVGTAEQAGMNMQGMNMQGMNMQGMRMHGFVANSATLASGEAVQLYIDRGEVVALRGSSEVRGTQLVGMQLLAQVQRTSNPTVTAEARYRVTGIQAELAAYDPTRTGATYLYTLEQWVPDTQRWQPACPADSDGRRVAIPLDATWDARGAREESSTHFTFGCTTGVIAKCYRWGYRPWLTGYDEDMAVMHQTCTRMARADYCGDGTPHTVDGTRINSWDNLSPAPIQTRAGILQSLGMLFEAGWGPDGAVCLSHTRWITLSWLIFVSCPDKLIPLGIELLTCNSLLEVLDVAPDARMFNASYLSLSL